MGIRAGNAFSSFPINILDAIPLKMGIEEDQMPVWNPYAMDVGGNTEQAIENSRVILWKGHCSVHQMFRPEHVAAFRERDPEMKILVHPECPRNVNDLADVSGSTGKIISTVQSSPAGTKWAIGTELHLVNRLKAEHPEQEIHFLSPVVCMCATMYRIDLPHPRMDTRKSARWSGRKSDSSG